MSGAPALRQERDAEGVLLLTLDAPGERVNALGRRLVPELESLLDELPGRRDVRAVVLCSGKADSFVVGADVRELRQVRSAREAEELSRGAQRLLGRLERLPRPTVAAIHGSCLGAGVEIALACHYRVASDAAVTRLGLPEVKLGLIPGAGGTWRLPRRIGLALGLEWIVSGRESDAEAARRAGLLDAVVPEGRLIEEARRAALDLAEGRLRPSRAGVSAAERLSRRWIARRARARLQSLGGHYPAPLRAVEVVTRGAGLAEAEALALESRAFAELVVSDAARALTSLFFATRELGKDPGYPEEAEARPLAKLGVVGAGLMGSGIAAAAADAGLAVRLRDADGDALGRGLRAARGVFEERRRRGRLSARELEQRMNRISGTVDATGFARCGLVVEAVPEELELKRRVVAELEERVDAGCVIGSNTSSLPIGEIAHGAKRPERIVGTHFFSPVHRMPLLEVVVTPEADPFAVATAVAFGRRLGKHVIAVCDGPGFYTTRILAAMLDEAVRALQEGARVEELDAAMTAWGFPLGPLALLDEVGLDVAAEVSAVLRERLPRWPSPPGATRRLLASGRRGRKSGRGLYRHTPRGRQPDREVYALLDAAERSGLPAAELQDRLVFSLLAEAVRCLEDEVLRAPRDGDVGAVFGLGFPPFLGGPFRHLDRLGARYATEVMQRLEQRWGERFGPPGMLVDQARSGGAFYP